MQSNCHHRFYYGIPRFKFQNPWAALSQPVTIFIRSKTRYILFFALDSDTEIDSPIPPSKNLLL